MTPKLPVLIKNGRLHFQGSSLDYIGAQKDGWYMFTLTKPKSRATWSMFKYLFGGQYKLMLNEMGEYQSGENLQKIHEIMKERHGVTEIREEMHIGVSGNIEKKEELLPKKARYYTVEEMQLFWQGNQQFGAEFLGLNIPDPDKDWKERWTKERQSK